MKKNILSFLIIMLMIPSMLLGCGEGGGKSGVPSLSRGAKEAPTYAFIPKSADNAFNEKQAEGFEKAVKSAGASCIVEYPKAPTADAQTDIIQSLIAQKVDGICIAANDDNALHAAIEEAENAGIKICSIDSALSPELRAVHLNQSGTEQIGMALLDGVYDIAGGEGQWAILSATFQATNQRAWIDVMKTAMDSDPKYKDLKLVEVAYGDDDPLKSVAAAKSVISEYPELKVICAPTTVGIVAAANVLSEQGSSVKLTGLGLPSEMQKYIGDDESHPCPFMFLWNPVDLGSLGGYTIMALCDGSITGKSGESFTCGLGEFTIVDASDGGTEIILGAPFRFDSSNIDEWAEVY